MRCPTLSELPPPPPGKTGWPWTEESPQLPETMPDPSTLRQAQGGVGSGQAAPWPRVSIVTPSYNQGQFIEETIRSVLLQWYPNLEYMIIDGGSTDGSVEIIRKYEPWLAYWVSEPDRGQSHALNKGFARATGELLGWLNSDDLYVRGVLPAVGKAYSEHPGSIIAGAVVDFDMDTGEEWVIQQWGLTFETMVKFWEERSVFRQPGFFFPRLAYEGVARIDESLHYAMDYDLFCRLLQRCQVTYIDRILARARFHDTSKTMTAGPLGIPAMARYECSRRYWHLLSSVDESTCKQEVAKGNFAWANQQRVQGHPKQAIAILGRSVRAMPMETALVLCKEAQLWLRARLIRSGIDDVCDKH